MNDYLLIPIILVALAIIYLVFKSSRPAIVRAKPKTYAGPWELIYSDAKDSNFKGESNLLVSKEYELTGKPDYIYRHRISGKIAVAELKSGSIADKQFPYRGDLLQLAAYFLLAREAYGKTPKEGRLIYADRMFIVKNTKALRRSVLTVMDEMREMLETGEGIPNTSFVGCKYCICKGTVCEHDDL